MGLVMGNGIITGDTTPHIAVHTEPGQWGWAVSFLRHRDYARAQAVAAMHLAELIAQGRERDDPELTERLARQLDMLPCQAATLAKGPALVRSLAS